MSPAQKSQHLLSSGYENTGKERTLQIKERKGKNIKILQKVHDQLVNISFKPVTNWMDKKTSEALRNVDKQQSL